ncbi:hypothetical protein [Comamonas testosteroni]|uniref:hypothetical protein n=1 Tax=Comamonas testosteroni TaxID=285 RepID=UPI0005B371EA|nr:hypothetical protein [Comamonas testosteroni]
MSTLNLPDPVAVYFAADRQGADAVARCFTMRGVVNDEGRTYIGSDAIKAWKLAASAAYTYTCEPLAVELHDGVYLVTSRVVGHFPGSPIELSYGFRLERGLIASLEISA